MQYDKNQIYFTLEHKNQIIKIYTNDVVPAVMPQSKIKKEYIYAAGIAIVIIILMNNK